MGRLNEKVSQMKRFAEKARFWLTRDMVRAIEGQRIATEKQTALLKLQRLPDSILTVRHLDQEIRFFLPDGSTDKVQRAVMISEYFRSAETLLESQRRYGLKGANVVDIGANIGNHSLFWSAVCGAHVDAFEPNPRVTWILERNIAINAADIVLHKVGLSERSSRLAIDRARPSNLGETSFRETASGAFEGKRLDDVELPAPMGLVKIDVEGMAVQVIKGASETLFTQRPPIIVEAKEDREDCRAALKKIGYREVQSYSPNDLGFEFGGRS